MNRVKFPLLLAVLAMAIAVQPVVAQSTATTPSSAQSGSTAQDPAYPSTTQSTPANPDSSSMSQTMDSQTFTGKVTKSGGKYVLKDDTTRTSYALDDQDQAKQFDGKLVKVTGRLDASSNIIRVALIEPGS